MNFPAQLLDAYWHTTSVERYDAIINSGYIHPEPNISGFRYGTAQGSEYFPFVRMIGGISIFDFIGFKPKEYSERFPSSSWYSFVPAQKDWNEAIWIQLSPEKMPGKFLDGSQLKAMQEDQYAYKNKLMPRIECAHIGSIPTGSFVTVLLYKEGRGFSECEIK